MNEKNKKISDGSIPENIIHQLNEFAPGGFIIFYFNSETGETEEIMTFDSQAYRLALLKHIQDWSAATNFLDVEIEKAQMLIAFDDENPDTEENKTN